MFIESDEISTEEKAAPLRHLSYLAAPDFGVCGSTSHDTNHALQLWSCRSTAVVRRGIVARWERPVALNIQCWHPFKARNTAVLLLLVEPLREQRIHTSLPTQPFPPPRTLTIHVHPQSTGTTKRTTENSRPVTLEMLADRFGPAVVDPSEVRDRGGARVRVVTVAGLRVGLAKRVFAREPLLPSDVEAEEEEQVRVCTYIYHFLGHGTWAVYILN